MTADNFRTIALSLPDATESAHMNHPDFRVRNKIFATLGYPADGWGMVKLTPNQQKLVLRSQPEAFVPAKGAWGKAGATTVLLAKARTAIVKKALSAAWSNTAAPAGKKRTLT